MLNSIEFTLPDLVNSFFHNHHSTRLFLDHGSFNVFILLKGRICLHDVLD